MQFRFSDGGENISLSIILGTRPEIIKMSPVIRECERRGLEYFILHMGQHYSYNMDRVFFEQLGLPEVKYNLEAGSGEHGRMEEIYTRYEEFL